MGDLVSLFFFLGKERLELVDSTHDVYVCMIYICMYKYSPSR